jgi:AbiTii
MAGLVLELQRAALDEKSSVSSLLRKALVVATKLQVSDFESWARAELEGYNDDAVPIPEYRKISGAPKVWNPYHGYQDLNCGSAVLAEKISTMPLGASIDALENDKGKAGGTWMFSYPPAREHALMKAMTPPAMKPSLHISETVIRSVIGRVRTIVLQWSLTLEKQGVLGEGMTFTQEERKKAQSSVHIDTYIHGVSGSQIQVNSPGAQQQQGMLPEQLAELRKLVDMIDGALHGATDSEEIRELRAEVATLKAQSESPKPKRSVIRESLSSVRAILEGAAGEVLAHHLPELSAILPQATAMVHELLKYITPG